MNAEETLEQIRRGNIQLSGEAAAGDVEPEGETKTEDAASGEDNREDLDDVWLPSRPLELSRELCEPPGVIGDLSRYITETARCERPALSLAASVALWGTLFGKRYVTSERSANRSNFYITVVVESSGGKDHPQKVIIGLMRRADALEMLEAEVTSDTAIEQALKEGWGVKLFLMDECGEFLKAASAANRNASPGQATILECLKKLYSCADSTYVSKRKVDKPRIFITNPQANFYGTTTPARFAAGMSPEEIEGGWTGRCLVFLDPVLVRGKEKPTIPYPPGLAEAVKRFAPDKGSEPPEPTTVHFTEDGRRIYERFDGQVWDLREKLADSRNPYRAIFGKVTENAKKLGLAFACSRCAYDQKPLPSIDGAAAAWGCRVAWICAANLYLYASEHASGSEYAELKSWAWREIKAAGVNGITAQKLKRRRRSARSKDVDEVLGDLVDAGEVVEIETEPSGKRGRPPAARYVAACWNRGSGGSGTIFCPEVLDEK